MDFLDAAISIGGSILSGGATGLIGTGLSLFADHFKRKQDLEAKRLDHAHDLALRADDRLTIQAEYDGQERVAKVEGEAAEAVADAGAFSASFNMEPKRFADPKKAGPVVQFLWGILDFWRGLIRPGLTTYLVVIVTFMYWELTAILETHDGMLPLTKVEELVVLIVSTVLYLTTTVVLWWFGTRNKQKPPKATT